MRYAGKLRGLETVFEFGVTVERGKTALQVISFHVYHMIGDDPVEPCPETAVTLKRAKFRDHVDRYLPNDHRIPGARDHFDRAAAGLGRLDVDVA